VEERIEVARTIYAAKQDSYRSAYPDRYVFDFVDADGRVTESVSRPKAGWSDALAELPSGLPSEGFLVASTSAGTDP
jgi:hypothetical protein